MTLRNMAQITAFWSGWSEAVKHNSLPVRSGIGNLGVWYAPKVQEASYQNIPVYGKQLVINQPGLPSAYDSFEQNGWKFIALDSINDYPDGRGSASGQYQMNRLALNLNRTPASLPVLIFSHVPMMTIKAMINDLQRQPVDTIGCPVADKHRDVKQLNVFLTSTKMSG